MRCLGVNVDSAAPVAQGPRVSSLYPPGLTFLTHHMEVTISIAYTCCKGHRASSTYSEGQPRQCSEHELLLLYLS